MNRHTSIPAAIGNEACEFGLMKCESSTAKNMQQFNISMLVETILKRQKQAFRKCLQGQTDIKCLLNLSSAASACGMKVTKLGFQLGCDVTNMLCCVFCSCLIQDAKLQERKMPGPLRGCRRD